MFTTICFVLLEIFFFLLFLLRIITLSKNIILVSFSLDKQYLFALFSAYTFYAPLSGTFSSHLLLDLNFSEKKMIWRTLWCVEENVPAIESWIDVIRFIFFSLLSFFIFPISFFLFICAPYLIAPKDYSANEIQKCLQIDIMLTINMISSERIKKTHTKFTRLKVVLHIYTKSYCPIARNPWNSSFFLLWFVLHIYFFYVSIFFLYLRMAVLLFHCSRSSRKWATPKPTRKYLRLFILFFWFLFICCFVFWLMLIKMI